MAGQGVALATRGAEAAPGEATAGCGRRFTTWATLSYLVVTTGVLLLALRRTGGRLIYVIDDPAIHLSVAQNLAHHATWGVVPGHFQSASSSPLWTVLLAAWVRLAPGPDTLAPLALNILAGLAVIVVLGHNQRVLDPGPRRPLDLLAVGALVSVILYLPALAFTGMEHTLHIALALPAVILFHRQVTGRPGWGPAWLPYLLLALATLVRFETAFVALGIGLALVITPADVDPRANGDRGTARWLDAVRGRGRRSLLVLLSSGLPLVGFGLFNRLMGQGFLPNSVMAKTNLTEGSGSNLTEGLLGRFASDPLVAALVGIAVVALLVLGPRHPAWSFPAVVVAVTVGFHMVLARMGWYDRYQAYLIALGVSMVLSMLGALLPADRRPPARAALVPCLVAVALLFTEHKPAEVFNARAAVEETYIQRYQAGRFFQRYYEGQPIATGELGYISLLHDGPLTDVFGLGDYEVLQEWQREGRRPRAAYWRDLAEERGFEVVAVYPITLFDQIPDTWISVGHWDANQWISTAPSPIFQFFATTPEAVRPLREHLQDFESELPPGVSLVLNEMAELRAMELS